MSEATAYLIYSLIIGIGATAFMDLFGVAMRVLFKVPMLNYGLVGRWLAYMPRGRFRHASVAASPALPGERSIGWAAHYACGVVYAAGLLAVWGAGWARAPSLGPALIVGLATLAAPFLVMQPGMGAGVAARLTPAPWKARARSLANHGAFGLGLYLAALAAGPLPL